MSARRMRDRMTKLFGYLTVIVTAGDKFNAEKHSFQWEDGELNVVAIIRYTGGFRVNC